MLFIGPALDGDRGIGTANTVEAMEANRSADETDPGASEDDLRYLDRARRIARRGWGRVHPNPMVGCLLVRDGVVVAEGYHRAFGAPHAEVEALERAGRDARGATAYVSLEPCAHHGKTPPCCDALVDAGVRRVVYGASDPGAESAGGAGRLREAGVEVVGPVLSRREARRDNRIFFHAAEEGTTYVEVKLAMSLDGGIAASPGERTGLTGREALKRVHRLRAGFDAVLVGARTVEVDDPLLTVREAPRPRKAPIRMVVDSTCRTSPDDALFRDVGAAPVVVFTTSEADAGRVEALEAAGARVVRRPRSGRGVDLTAVLEWCWEHDVRSVLCEGGGELAASVLEEGLCRRIDLFLAPRVLGSGAVPAFPEAGVDARLDGWRVVDAEAPIGRDGLLVLEPASDGTEERGGSGEA